MGPIRTYLRNATAAAHDRVDVAFGRHDMSRRDGYASFLLCHAAVLPSMEQALETIGIGEVVPDWPLRTRRGALGQDLAAMHLSEPASLPMVPLDGEAALLGAAYVLEGSRLGGALLLRRAQASADPAILAATAYLRHGLGQGFWASFLDLLEASESARANPDRVVEGARLTFAAFEAAATTTPRLKVEHDELAR